MTYGEIIYTVADRVATITLNRPERLNAWTPVMAEEVRTAMGSAVENDEVRVIVLTGAGRGFCPGADMAELQRGAEHGVPTLPEQSAAEQVVSALTGTKMVTELEGIVDSKVRTDFQKRYSYFPAIPKPIIAAVNGPAAGLGLILALCCDLRFASEKARFTTAFSRRGLIAEHGISWLLTRTVGLPNALDLLLYAGNLAETQGSSRLLPEHVRRVHSEMHPSITEEDILDLPKREHLIVLFAVVRSLRGSKKAYASMKDIRLNCAEVCEEMRLKPIADIDDYIQDLSDRRIIEVESLREIGIKGAPTENLETYLDSLFKRIEAGIVGGS